MISLNEMAREFIGGFRELPVAEVQFRCLCEEYEEVLEAYHARRPDDEKLLKELCDLIVTIQNFAYLKGYNLDKAMKRVHDSNMSKFVNATYRDDGKLMKNENYVPPILGDCIR